MFRSSRETPVTLIGLRATPASMSIRFGSTDTSALALPASSALAEEPDGDAHPAHHYHLRQRPPAFRLGTYVNYAGNSNNDTWGDTEEEEEQTGHTRFPRHNAAAPPYRQYARDDGDGIVPSFHSDPSHFSNNRVSVSYHKYNFYNDDKVAGGKSPLAGPVLRRSPPGTPIHTLQPRQQRQTPSQAQPRRAANAGVVKGADASEAAMKTGCGQGDDDSNNGSFSLPSATVDYKHTDEERTCDAFAVSYGSTDSHSSLNTQDETHTASTKTAKKNAPKGSSMFNIQMTEKGDQRFVSGETRLTTFLKGLFHAKDSAAKEQETEVYADLFVATNPAVPGMTACATTDPSTTANGSAPLHAMVGDQRDFFAQCDALHHQTMEAMRGHMLHGAAVTATAESSGRSESSGKTDKGSKTDTHGATGKNLAGPTVGVQQHFRDQRTWETGDYQGQFQYGGGGASHVGGAEAELERSKPAAPTRAKVNLKAKSIYMPQGDASAAEASTSSDEGQCHRALPSDRLIRVKGLPSSPPRHFCTTRNGASPKQNPLFPHKKSHFAYALSVEA